jgi:hypothetical protein
MRNNATFEEYRYVSGKVFSNTKSACYLYIYYNLLLSFTVKLCKYFLKGNSTICGIIDYAIFEQHVS